MPLKKDDISGSNQMKEAEAIWGRHIVVGTQFLKKGKSKGASNDGH